MAVWLPFVDVEIGTMDLAYRTNQLFYTDKISGSIYYIDTNPNRMPKQMLFHSSKVIAGSMVVDNINKSVHSSTPLHGHCPSQFNSTRPTFNRVAR